MATELHRKPWNKGIIVGQKAPLKLKEVWAIRMRLQLAHRERDLALFNLGVDSKLRACDLVQLRVRDICRGDRVASRAMVMQQKTHRPVQFEITGPTREALTGWIQASALRSDDWQFCRPDRSCAPLYTTILKDRSSLDRAAWRRCLGVWNALHQKNEGIAPLQTNEESSSRPVAVRSYEARTHRALSWYRSGRRACDGRAD
jgi:hypothetical protein